MLVGIGAGFAVNAFIDYLITRAEINDVQRATIWLTGSLNGRSWDEVRIVAVALAALGPLAIIMQGRLDRLDLGDDTAAALGINVARSKLALVSSPSASPPRAAAGPIAFVAFVAGPTPVASPTRRVPVSCLRHSSGVGHRRCDLAARRLLPDRTPGRHHDRRTRRLLWLLARQPGRGHCGRPIIRRIDDVPSRLEPQ